MPTYIDISCEQLKTLFDNLHESINTVWGIEVWNALIDDRCICGHEDPYGIVYVKVCAADVLNKLKLIKIPRAETVNALTEIDTTDIIIHDASRRLTAQCYTARMVNVCWYMYYG